MLVRFSVQNFLSFDDKQEITMIPAKRVKGKKEHIIPLGNISLLSSATIYGANASGKSNLIEAIRFAKHVVTQNIPLESSNMYCRIKEENKKKPTTFEFEFYKNNKYYAYGFSLNLDKQVIIGEWLYELLPKNAEEKMLFEREPHIQRLELGQSIKLSDTDEMRFNTYKIDFGENDNSLFLKEMNRNKKIISESKLSFFRDVYDWFKEDLVTIFPDQPITYFEYFYGNGSNTAINKIIDTFDTGISKVKIQKITLAEFKDKISSDIADRFIKSFRERLEEDGDKGYVQMSMRATDAFYNITGEKGKEPIITTIMLEHGNSFSDFEFSEESDGTRRLFDLLDILINNEKNKVYIIDEIDRSLHPKLTYRFIELFFEILKESNNQLIFTTHESTIMDQELLRRDEIWFVERDKENASKLYSLDRFKERYDKKLSKAYLNGRYGAIPVFKRFAYKDGVQE